MLVIPITFNLDKQQSVYPLTEIIASHDIQSIKFELSFNGIDLTGKTVKVLSKYESSGSQTLLDCLIVDGKAILIPDTSLISGDGYVHNYIYIYEGASSLDVQEFLYETKLSEIDRSSVVIKKVYDKSYNNLLLDFEQALNEYKLTMPELSAEIDVVLNQAIGDWEQGADALVDGKLIEIHTDASTLIDGAIDDFNVRGDAEITAWRVDADVELEDYLADRVVLKNELINGNFVSTVSPWSSGSSTATLSEGFVEVTPAIRYGGIVQNRNTTEYNGRFLYIGSLVNAKTTNVCVVNHGNPGVASAYHSGSGNWEWLSFIQTPPADATRLRVEVRDNSTTPTEKFQVKYVEVIDLTATFGAGNEPTKAEMDELIKITGYFDEITLTQKQLLSWQLKLMRQNRNALIALGGTII